MQDSGTNLTDHPLSCALTATADIPAVYLQQLWKIVHKVPNTKDTIRFKFDTQDITYTVDMFRDTLKLPVETPENLFVVPATIEIIESFMHTIGYSFFMKNLAQPWHKMFKDDIPLVSVYTTGNMIVRGMLISDAFLTKEIRATDDYKEYETVFVNVVVPINQPQSGKKRKQSAGETSSPRKSLKVTIRQKKQSTTLIPLPSDDRERDEIDEETLLSLALHKTAISAEAQENVAKVQEKLAEEEIQKMVKGKEDDESYVSGFADSMLNNDADDSGTRIEPRSHFCKWKTNSADDEASLIIADLMKKYPFIPHRPDEDYHFIKDDIPLLLKHKENVAKVQEKLPKEEIENMVEGEEDEESYASEFADSMFNDDDDDSDTRIEPLSHKENLKVVDEDEVNDKVKKDEKKNDDAEKQMMLLRRKHTMEALLACIGGMFKFASILKLNLSLMSESKDDNVEKTDDVAEEKDNDDQTDHTLTDQNAEECDDECATLANLIANLKLDVDENKKIQKQLKKANTSLAHELKECKSIFVETSRTLGESNSIRDNCLIALQK
ncbi:hypothetical protein Tco_1191322 [Tanacetum coccineum]